MSDLSNYFRAQAETEAARQLRNYASAKLELCQIKERLAEIYSQHEPIASLCGPLEGDFPPEKAMRTRLQGIANYVVIGRFPPE